MRTAADRRRALVLGPLGALALSACGSGPAGDPGSPTAPSLPRGDDPVELDPAAFTPDITHRYWPMRPGDRWVYEETDGGGSVQRVEVTVLDRTRTTADGVEARVVHDVVTEGGRTLEDTLDWYAQDAGGNVWCLGEQTAEYENGQIVSTEGSWEAGRDGAQPGILLPAEPRPGQHYRQEYLAGEAEDEAFVLSTGEQVQVPTGTYTGVLMTRETTPLEPDVVELKFYAPDVGPVLAVPVSGGAGREALVETTLPG